jgi:ADP-heptose:LPS heptosyltransferase/GT2 family glycosyltransferase
MPLLFDEYELLNQSGLFDAGYYLRANPDVAASNLDPLMHYLEVGCHERRDPSRDFNTAYYLTQCKALEKVPDNALFHYLTVGASQGLAPRPDYASRAPVPAELWAPMLFVDVPRIVNGAADAPVRGGLAIVGWGVAPGAESRVEIRLDGNRITDARGGIRRPDVVSAHPTLDGGLLSGFSAHLPAKVLPTGFHQVSVRLVVADTPVSEVDFRIEVQEVPDDEGPWALRRSMRQAEVGTRLTVLARQRWQPWFSIILPIGDGRVDVGRLIQTAQSLVHQRYGKWEAFLVPTGSRPASGRRFDALLETLKSQLESEPMVRRFSLLEAKPPLAASSFAPSSSQRSPISECVLRLRPGDELGVDALLEFALASALNPDADLLYCDDRRLDLPNQKPHAFFKPGWSPDLLLSSNYIGRAWCARQSLVSATQLTLGELAVASDYDVVLRMTEKAHRVLHVARVLLQNTNCNADRVSQQRAALTASLKRRGISAKILDGRVKGSFRVRRGLTGGRVSIIIPTRAAGGLIKTCIDSLRSKTDYRDYEVICIENISPDDIQWKRWLRESADVVVETTDKFNWSRYNNLAVTRATGRYLLFLNDDTEIIDSSWLSALVEHGQRPEVGVVGPQLLYPDRSVQHAGVMLDSAGRGRHAFRGLEENDPGYFGLALSERNVVSVTGACLLTRRETFDGLSGFDEAHAVINNDLDFCLRAWTKGLLNVYTPHSRLIHHELVSRSNIPEDYDDNRFQGRWRGLVDVGDPYFNRNLSRDSEPFTIEREPFEVVHAAHPLFLRESIRRILVVKLDHIGDCITSLPALRRLRHHFPKAEITVLAGSSTRRIWAAEPAVGDVIEFNYFNPRSGLGKVTLTEQDLNELQRLLQSKRFDLAIDLRKQPDTRQILALSDAEIMIGFDHQGRFPWLDVALEWDEDVPLRAKRGHVSDDLVALVEAVAIQSSEDRKVNMAPTTARLSITESEELRLWSKPVICVHPSAGSPMRQWPVNYFSRLIELLLSDGGANIALIGGADEREVAKEILSVIKKTQDVFDFVGRLSMDELPVLLLRAVLFVGNNSGPQHMAAALGTPTVGIHSGVIDSEEWGPLGSMAVAVRRQTSCSPCYIEFAKNCPRSLACLTKLSVTDVYETCRTMIATGQALDGSIRDVIAGVIQ